MTAQMIAFRFTAQPMVDPRMIPMWGPLPKAPHHADDEIMLVIPGTGLDKHGKKKPSQLRVTVALTGTPEPRVGSSLVVAGEEQLPPKIDAFGVLKFGATVWAINPSIVVSGVVHAFVILCDVPVPAPWELLPEKKVQVIQ